MKSHASDPETVLFVRVHDFCLWLTRAVEKFPRSQRFLLASRLQDTAFALHTDLIQSRKVEGQPRSTALLAADVKLESLRLQLRLAQELTCISMTQYEHAARLLSEIGRLLGSRIKGSAGSGPVQSR